MYLKGKIGKKELQWVRSRKGNSLSWTKSNPGSGISIQASGC